MLAFGITLAGCGVVLWGLSLIPTSSASGTVLRLDQNGCVSEWRDQRGGTHIARWPGHDLCNNRHVGEQLTLYYATKYPDRVATRNPASGRVEGSAALVGGVALIAARVYLRRKYGTTPPDTLPRLLPPWRLKDGLPPS